MKIQIGDSVVWRKAYLRNIGECVGDLPFDRGTILGINPFIGNRYIALITWDIAGTYSTLIDNVILQSEVHKEPN